MSLDPRRGRPTVPQASACQLPQVPVTTAKYNRLIVPQLQTWEHFAHQADIGVRGTGATLSEVFEQAACGLTAVITDPEGVRATHAVEIRCQARDPELLLVDWLNAIVYEMIDVCRHQPAVEIKGATMTEFKVTQDGDGRWIAQCIVDV